MVDIHIEHLGFVLCLEPGQSPPGIQQFEAGTFHAFFALAISGPDFKLMRINRFNCKVVRFGARGVKYLHSGEQEIFDPQSPARPESQSMSRHGNRVTSLSRHIAADHKAMAQ